MFRFRFHYDLYLFFKLLDLSKSSKSSLGLCHRLRGIILIITIGFCLLRQDLLV